jgi:hypothetical protein
MKLETLRKNLLNTIAGKEKMLADLCPHNPFSGMFLDEGEMMVRRASIEFLTINIRELKRILWDVEKCIEGEANANCN